MRIALVSEWLDSWRGGAETSTLQFLHHLMDSGTEVHVYTRSRPSPTPDLTVHTISGASMTRTRRSVTFAHRVERRLRAESFDVVHAISPCRGVDIYQPRGGTVAETIQRNIALRQSPAGRSIKQFAGYFNLKQRFMLQMERQLMLDPRGPIVVAISDYVVNQLKSHYDLPDHRVRKIFNGVNILPSSKTEVAEQRRAIRLEFGVKNDQLLVLTVAHNFRLKGVARWLEALALLRSRGVTDVRAIVLGKGDSPRWHRLVKRLETVHGLNRHRPLEVHVIDPAGHEEPDCDRYEHERLPVSSRPLGKINGARDERVVSIMGCLVCTPGRGVLTLGHYSWFNSVKISAKGLGNLSLR